jgi:hypothetical protein
VNLYRCLLAYIENGLIGQRKLNIEPFFGTGDGDHQRGMRCLIHMLIVLMKEAGNSRVIGESICSNRNWSRVMGSYEHS